MLIESKLDDKANECETLREALDSSDLSMCLLWSVVCLKILH